jgi:hypothetical protein
LGKVLPTTIAKARAVFQRATKSSALDDARRRIECSKAPWSSDDYSAVGRTILAEYIITTAKGDERDAKWLADSAVLYLSQRKLTRQAPEAL